MSELTRKQSLFAERFSELVLVAISLGYQVAYGDGFRDPRVTYGHPKSLHRDRLAHDLVLRDRDGTELGDEAHNELHDIWDKMGGAERIEGDLNHYSFAWNGMR